LSSGFFGKTDAGPSGCANHNADGLKAEPRIGLSGIIEEGCFVACGARNYCAAAVKTVGKNAFTAHIKRGSNDWEAL